MTADYTLTIQLAASSNPQTKMRRYDILFGILLILSIINLALTAPVLVQEKCHACVDAMHTPKDKIAALERRGNDDLDRLAKMAVDYIKNYLKKVQKPNVSPNPASATAPEIGRAHV